MLARIKAWARNLKRDSHAIYLASRDPRVPWYAKALAIAVAAYALSPIDLIPDFIPVIGYLDDLIIVPLGIWLVVRLIPDEVMVDCRTRADAAGQRPVSRAGMIAIIVLWIVGAMMLGWIGYVSWSRYRWSGLHSDEIMIAYSQPSWFGTRGIAALLTMRS